MKKQISYKFLAVLAMISLAIPILTNSGCCGENYEYIVYDNGNIGTESGHSVTREQVYASLQAGSEFGCTPRIVRFQSETARRNWEDYVNSRLREAERLRQEADRREEERRKQLEGLTPAGGALPTLPDRTIEGGTSGGSGGGGSGGGKCLAKGTLIDTPNGQVPVEQLRKGMTVWTLDDSGNRVAATVAGTTVTPVPPSWQMVRVKLNDGRTVTASLGHPTSEGRVLGDYQVGDTLDGGLLVEVVYVEYDCGATYDLLPSSWTGFYWANKILLKSILKIN